MVGGETGLLFCAQNPGIDVELTCVVRVRPSVSFLGRSTSANFIANTSARLAVSLDDTWFFRVLS